MARNLTTGLQRGLRRSIAGGLGAGDLFSTAALDLRFAQQKTLDPRITFTRASSGTYVGSDGLIKTATTNLLLRSEEIGTSPWGTNSPGSVAYTANAIAAPTGAATADRVTATVDFAGPNQFASVISGLSYSFSFYVKAVTPGSLNSIRIECFSGRFATFNITTRVFSGVNAAITPSSVSLGDGWVRVQCFFAAPSTGSLAVAVYANTSSDFYLWGAQLEQSSTVGEYIPTTSTINSAPRFDHNPTTGESLGLLVEEQRTNLVTSSATFQPSSGGSPASYTVDQVAPDGTTTASRQTATNPRTFVDYTGIANAQYTFSVYAKAASGTVTIALLLKNAASDTLITTGSNVTLTTAWQRLTVTGTTNGATTGARIEISGPVIGAPAGTVFWGAQLEAGSFPTSYIPTTTATVTRSADVASITGANFSSWYNQTEGTVFYDGQVLGSDLTINDNLLGISDGTTNNTIDLFIPSGLNQRFRITNGGVNQVLQNAIPTANVYSPVKAAYAFRFNDATSAGNGTVLAADTSCTIPTVDRFTFGSLATGEVQVAARYKRVTFWPSRLPNSTLQQITQ